MYNDFGSELKYTGIIVYTFLPNLREKKINTKSKNSQTRVETQHSSSDIQHNKVLTKPGSILSTEKVLASQAFSFLFFFFFLQMFYTMHEELHSTPYSNMSLVFFFNIEAYQTMFSTLPIPLQTPQCSIVKLECYLLSITGILMLLLPQLQFLR